MAMLEVKDLEVYYGVIQALKGISFDVDQGDIVALIGANGAGKTTTLHTITFGWLIRARPIASICCSPPDKVPANWFFLSSRRGKRL